MKVGLFGCGAYGMALSSIMIENDCDITMWTKFEQEKKELEETRKNERLIPNFSISEKIKLTTSVEECIKDKDLLVIAIPAAFIDSLAVEMKPYIKDNHILIATKGIELATENEETEKLVKQALANSYIKLRATKDIIGTEICGSIKNVIALSAGMLEGLGANDSTTAMLLTEAIHDMREIIDAFHGDKKTVLSFAGFGDLLLTCTSVKSRNFRFGKLLGEKRSKEEIKEFLANTTVEGFYTLESIYKLLKDKKVSIPIIDLIYDIAVEGKNPETLLTFLVEKE